MAENPCVESRAEKMTAHIKEMVKNRQSEDLKRFPYAEEVPRDAVVLYMKSLGALMNDEVTSYNTGFATTRFVAKSGKVLEFTYNGRKDGLSPIRAFMEKVAEWVGESMNVTLMGLHHANIIGTELKKTISDYEKQMARTFEGRIDTRVAGMIGTYLHRMNTTKEQTVYESCITEMNMRTEIQVIYEQKPHLLMLTVLDTPEIAIDKMAVFFSKFMQ